MKTPHAVPLIRAPRRRGRRDKADPCTLVIFGGAGDAFDLTAVGKGVAAGEHLFVNTYLLGVTTFAAAGHSRYARYAAEIAAIEDGGVTHLWRAGELAVRMPARLRQRLA